jgi:glycosyltransferase involved in cell wall biosynthesis
MISVVIVTRDAEERLVRSLAALAPLAVDGLVSDVIVADRGSRDASAAVADAAGCAFIADCPDMGAAVERAARLARKAWLLGLVAGDIVDDTTAAAMRAHIAQSERMGSRQAVAFLALPGNVRPLRRAVAAIAFDILGLAAPADRRVLAPRTEVHWLACLAGIWRGMRMKERIGSSE